MKVAFLDLARRTRALRPELDEAIALVLDESRLVLGSPVETFEREFADYCGAAEAVGVGSGTDALSLALQAVGVAEGDEVITVANTCVPTVSAIESIDAVPVLIDPDPETYTMNPASLDDAVTDRTRAIVPVHLYGQCADIDALMELANSRGLSVVEDAAQAHGATDGDRRTGTLGHAAAFSFYPTKNLGALGDAGAVVTNDPEVAARVRLLRNYGEVERYQSVVPGRNSRLDTIQASALSVGLRALDAGNERRRQLAAAYSAAFAELPIVLPSERPGSRHVYHLYVVRVDDRDAFREELAALGIDTLVHYPRPVHAHPAYTRLRTRPLEVSERLSTEIVSLPLYPELTDGEAETVIEAVVRVAARR